MFLQILVFFHDDDDDDDDDDDGDDDDDIDVFCSIDLLNMFNIFFKACHATIPEYSDYPKGAIDVNAFDNIYTSIGLPLRLMNNGSNHWSLNMRWREEPADIAKISVTMDFSAQFGIFLKTELGEMIKVIELIYKILDILVY